MERAVPLQPLIVDEIDRRAQALRESGEVPSLLKPIVRPYSERALRRMYVLVQERLGRLTGRALIFDFNEVTCGEFTIGISLRANGRISRQNVMRIEGLPSQDRSAAPESVDFYASAILNHELARESDMFLHTQPEDYDAVAESYADLFLDTVALGVANGWDVV